MLRARAALDRPLRVRLPGPVLAARCGDAGAALAGWRVVGARSCHRGCDRRDGIAQRRAVRCRSLPRASSSAGPWRSGYAVPAINVVNDLTLEAVLAAAEELRSPLIVQTSVKTVRSIGRRRAQGDVGRHDGEHPGTRGPAPRPLSGPRGHQRLPGGGLELGALRWPRALRRGERAPVRRGRGRGASIRRRRRGRDRGHPRRRGRPRLRRGGTGPDARGRRRLHPRAPAWTSSRPPSATPTACTGRDRRSTISASATSWRPPASPWPSTAAPASRPTSSADLIARGCAKVNVSTALKIAYMEANREYLTSHPAAADPPKLFDHVREAVMEMTRAAHPPLRRGGSRVRTAGRMRALILDCDGVLADTERDGHLPAFNQTFAEFGLPVRWSEADYGRALRIGGGKERMAALLTPELVAAAGLPADREAQLAEVARWHRRKTETLRRDGGGRSAAAAARHRADRGRGTGRGLAAGRLLDVGRALGARHPRAAVGPEAGGRCPRAGRRHRGSQEAGTGHLPAGPRAARDRAQRMLSSSRIRATGSWPHARPASRRS